jgi:hypothetical protein
MEEALAVEVEDVAWAARVVCATATKVTTTTMTMGYAKR